MNSLNPLHPSLKTKGCSLFLLKQTLTHVKVACHGKEWLLLEFRIINVSAKFRWLQ